MTTNEQFKNRVKEADRIIKRMQVTGKLSKVHVEHILKVLMQELETVEDNFNKSK